jgi:hypothetical protein
MDNHLVPPTPLIRFPRALIKLFFNRLIVAAVLVELVCTPLFPNQLVDNGLRGSFYLREKL